MSKVQVKVKSLQRLKLQNGKIQLLDDGKKFISFQIPIPGGYDSTVLSDRRIIKSLQRMTIEALKKK